MSKATKKFDFKLPQTEKVNRDMRMQVTLIGELHIKGTAELIDGRWDEEDGRVKYNIDFDSIEWNGTNVLDLLEIADRKGCSLLDECYEATYAHADYLFQPQTV